MNKFYNIIFLYLFANCICSFSIGSENISDLEIVGLSKNHSFRALGPDYSIPISVDPIPGARLVLFNYRAAQRLGIRLPSDPKKLEELILKNFALFVKKNSDEADNSSHYFSTYYQDSTNKGPGDALGDGRALWAGEMILPIENGHFAYLDFVLKGVGPTPLAWLNHSQEGHRDGLLDMNEAIHSFVLSEATLNNHIDSMIDLAVIEIPQLKMNKHTNLFEKAAISVRVGSQTRLAHLKYFTDDQTKFSALMDYVIRRDLGLSLDKIITQKEVSEFLFFFARNIGTESAYYFDLHAVHGSPTHGNRTTSGATIDMGTFRYLDAFHGSYKYLSKKVTVFNQETYFKSYISDLYQFMYIAKYPHIANLNLSIDTLLEIYENEKNLQLENLWLHRLGLDEEEISRLTETSKRNFVMAMTQLYKKNSENITNIGNQLIKPSLFEPRSIFPRLVQFAFENLDTNHLNEDSINTLFVTNRPWGSKNEEQIHKPQKHKLSFEPKPLDSIKFIIKSTQDIIKELNLTESMIDEISKRSKLIHDNHREIPGPANFYSPTAEIYTLIKNTEPKDYSFIEISNKALEQSDKLVDPIPDRQTKSPTYFGLSKQIYRNININNCFKVFKTKIN